MASKAKAQARRKPLIYPDSVRPPPVLPDAESVLEMGLTLTEDELTVIRMAMAIHTVSKQPKLTWTGWRHIATALAIGSKHARKAAKGHTPDYRRVMTDFLRNTGFTFLNKDDRAAAVGRNRCLAAEPAAPSAAEAEQSTGNLGGLSRPSQGAWRPRSQSPADTTQASPVPNLSGADASAHRASRASQRARRAC
jgi:hypothetical protein